MALITDKPSSRLESASVMAPTMFVMAAVLLASTSSASPMETGTSFHHGPFSNDKRILQSASSNFENFNNIFENASIHIPEEFQVSEKVAFSTLEMTIRNIKCYDMYVEDISVDHQQKSDTEYLVTVGVTNLDLSCEMDYDYSYGILSGDGWVQIETENSDVVSTIGFTSSDFDQSPPTGSTIDSCFSNVQIKNLDFEEDFASEVLEVFQGLIRTTVEVAIGDVACEELSVLGTAVVGNMVNLAGDQLEPYLDGLSEARSDPLYLEHNLNLPDGLKTLNLQDTEGPVGKTVHEILRFLDTKLGTATSSTEDELVINSLLRSFVLEDDGSLRLDSSSISTVTNPTLFEGHDRLTEFTIVLDEARLYGLDSITRLNSFRSIGKHTLQNELTWDVLKFEFDMILDMKPSTLDDAILVDPTSPGISERFTIDFVLNNIDVEASLLMVLDEDAMGSMKLGPLFDTDNLLPCLLSIVKELELSGLDVDPLYINDGPAVDGFLSSGFDRLISDSIEAAFTMYKGSLRAATPNMFQTTIRDIINDFIFRSFFGDGTSSTCPEAQPVNEEIVDFRKFFDAEDGTYGDVPAILKSMMDQELIANNPETGRPRINEALIAPLTGSQSGIEGTLIFPSDLFNFNVPKDVIRKFGMENIEFGMFDPMIEHLDTIGAPIQLLEPNATNGQILDNYATVGTDARNLRLGIKGLFAAEGDPLFTMTNQMDLSIELANSNAFLALMANVDVGTLFNFPLRDITNLQCWLNTIAASKIPADNNEKALSIVSAILAMNSINFNAECDACTSSSLYILPEILSSFEAFGVSDVLENRLLKLALDLLRSDYAQDLIDGILMDATMNCPHSSAFVGTSTSFAEKPKSEFPSIDFESLETVVFALIVLTETAAIVVAEGHELYDVEQTSPLSGQSDISVTKNGRLLDFTLLETSLQTRLGFSIADLNEFLNEIVFEADNLSEKNKLRFNTIIQSTMLNQDGILSVTFDDLSLNSVGLDISIRELNIVGLDSVSGLNLFDTVGNQTIQNEIIWENIGIQVVLSIDTFGGNPAKDIIISVGLSEINLSMALLLAIDLDLFESLDMWSVMELRKILPCVMSTAETASFTELELSVDSITDFSIMGFDSNELSFAADQSTRLVLEMYHDKIISSIPKVFDSTIRIVLNNWLEHFMVDQSSIICEYAPSERSNSLDFVDLRDLLWIPDVARGLGGSGLSQYGDMFRLGAGLIQGVFKIDDATGLSSFNKVVIEPFTKSKGNEVGSMHYSGDFYAGAKRVNIGALDTDVQFRAYDAKIENMNTVGAPLEVLGGIMGKAHVLNHTVTAGVGTDPLKFSSKFLLSLQGDDNINISNEIDLSLEMKDASIIASTLTKISESRLLGFPLRDFFDLNCWLATIPAPVLNAQGIRTDNSGSTAGLSDLDAFIGQLTVKANCTNCSSPRMKEFTDLLSAPDAQSDTTDVANALLAYVTQLMGGNFLQVQIDRMLNEAARKCPHSSTYDPDAVPVYEDFQAPDATYSLGYLILLTVFALTSIIIVLTIAFAVKCIVRRRHMKWLKRLSSQQIKNLSHHQRSKHDLEVILNTSTRSMFQSQDIPCIIRFMIPAVIICNVLFFLSGHLSLGAAVNIEAEIAGEKFAIEKFFEFSMARSTIAIWKAGGHELAILIIIFSGIWPYTKLFMTLWLWFSSPSHVSVSRRGSILLWLDWLAKWSMIDIFVLVISIAAFRISIESPDTSYLPNDFYAIEMMVVPRWGLYANMIAQLISQVTSHVIIHYHRRIITKATGRLKQDAARNTNATSSLEDRTQSQDSDNPINMGRLEQDGATYASSLVDISIDQNVILTPSGSNSTGPPDDEHISLSRVRFSRPHRGETEKLVARTYVNKLLVFCVVSIIVCVIIGCTLPSFSLELFGIVGVAVEYGQDFEEATLNHSVFSVIKLLFDQAGYLGTMGDYLGLIVLSILFVSTILFVPVIQSIVLLRQWFSNSTKKQKEKVSVRLEILQAWQYLEVYLVALFISSWQLGPVSDFMVNAYCTNLEDTFAQMVYYGVLKEEDAQCFGVSSRIGPNAFVLVTAAALLAFLSSFVSKAFVQYKYDGNPSKLLLKGNDDSTEASQANNSDPLVDTNIQQVPVLFTDTFRWMLTACNMDNKNQSSDPDNSDWSLPEATVISSENLTPDRPVMKGTYVNDLPFAEKPDTTTYELSPFATRSSSNQTSQGSLGLVSSISFDSYHSSLRPKMDINHNDDREGRQFHRASKKEGQLKSDVSIGQVSVTSKMDSIGSSSSNSTDDESIDSFIKSILHSSSRSSLKPPPPPEDDINTGSPGLFRRAPPPAKYRLSEKEKSLKKPPPTYPSSSLI